VVGFDDVRLAALVSVPLTTMHQPCREIAHAAFRAMAEWLTDPTIPPRLLALSPTSSSASRAAPTAPPPHATEKGLRRGAAVPIPGPARPTAPPPASPRVFSPAGGGSDGCPAGRSH
jgi:hypothetical protein